MYMNIRHPSKHYLNRIFHLIIMIPEVDDVVKRALGPNIRKLCFLRFMGILIKLLVKCSTKKLGCVLRYAR
jgi:hypothetical protein